jgi:hypothetical protein
MTGDDRTWTIKSLREGPPEYVPDGDPPVHHPLEVIMDGPWELEPGDQLVPVSELRRVREALEGFIQGFEWAYNDALYAAPEDMARRRRQWQVLGDRAEKARAALSVGEEGGRHGEV